MPIATEMLRRQNFGMDVQVLPPLQVLVIVHEVIPPLPQRPGVDARVLAYLWRVGKAYRPAQRRRCESFYTLAV